MALLSWVAMGLFVGALGGLIVPGGLGIVLDVALGVLGATAGGWLGLHLFGSEVIGFNSAVMGAIVLVVVCRALVESRRRKLL